MVYYTLIAIPTLLFSAMFLKLDGINIVREYVIEKKEKLYSLYDLVSTRHKSRSMILFVSAKMLSQAFYQNLLHYLDNSLTKIDKNRYELKYVINGKLYKKIIKPNRGPIPVISVINENGYDVTEEILPYMGPNNDFHNEKFTPKFFGYDKLTFEMLNGNILNFDSSDNISLS